MRIGLGAAVVLAACTGTAHAFGMDDVEDAASRVASHAKRPEEVTLDVEQEQPGAQEEILGGDRESMRASQMLYC